MSLALVFRIVLVMFLWSLCYPLITVGIEFSPHLTFAAMRAGFAGAALVLVGRLLGRRIPRARRTWTMLLLIGLGATTMGFLGMFHAAEFINPGMATVIANTQPVLAALAGSVFLGERLRAWAWAGLAVGFLGIVVITMPEIFSEGSTTYALGVAYITLAALGITVSNVLIKAISGRVDAIMGMGIQLLVGSIPLAIFAFTFEEPTTLEWSARFVMSLLGLAFFGTALAYWLWIRCLEEVPLTKANTFSFLIPVFGLTMGTVYYGESIRSLQFAGIFLTLVGVILVNRRSAVRE